MKDFKPEQINLFRKWMEQWKDFQHIEVVPEELAVENTYVNVPGSSKLLRNGQIFILRGDHTYTLQGQEVR